MTEGGAFAITGEVWCVQNGKEGALDEVLAVDAGAGEEYVGYLPQVG